MEFMAKLEEQRRFIAKLAFSSSILRLQAESSLPNPRFAPLPHHSLSGARNLIYIHLWPTFLH